jgi:hypothetical protein
MKEQFQALKRTHKEASSGKVHKVADFLESRFSSPKAGVTCMSSGELHSTYLGTRLP